MQISSGSNHELSGPSRLAITSETQSKDLQHNNANASVPRDELPVYEYSETKIDLDHQVFDKTTGAIPGSDKFPEVRYPGGPLISDYMRFCEGDEDCLKKNRIIQHVETFTIIYFWVSDHANILAMLNLLLVAFILIISCRRKKVDAKVKVPLLNYQNMSEISKDDIQVKLPISARLGPSKNLEVIPDFVLDKSEASQDEHVFEMQRRISVNSVFTHNNETGSMDMNSTRKHKYYSPKSESVREFKVSNTPSFAKQICVRHQLNDDVQSPIIEEASCSVSPSTSFKMLKSAFAKRKEEQSHEEYFKEGDDIIEVKTQKKVIYYRNSNRLRNLLSENFSNNDPKANIYKNVDMFHSFKNHPKSLKLLPMICDKEEDFTDNAMDIGRKLSQQKRNENFYLRSNRSKSFKEDDNEYFHPAT